jgi:hypothetical protein
MGRLRAFFPELIGIISDAAAAAAALARREACSLADMPPFLPFAAARVTT